MMTSEPSRASVFVDFRERDDFGADRIRWLITSRWIAMAGVFAAAWRLRGVRGQQWGGRDRGDLVEQLAARSGTPRSSLADVERDHIERVLCQMAGNITRATVALGVDRRTLQRKLRAYGLEAP